MKIKILAALILLLVISYFGFNFLKSNDNKASPPVDTTYQVNKADLDGYTFIYPEEFTKVNKDTLKFYAESENYFITADFIQDFSSYKSWLADIKSDLASNNPQVSSASVQGKEVLFESRMSAEGTFERNIFVETSTGLVWISVNGYTQNTDLDERTIYDAVEGMADDIAASLEFN